MDLDDGAEAAVETTDNVMSTIEKVGHPRFYILFLFQTKFHQLRKIIKSICSSPQRRQSWAREILFIQGSGNTSLMLFSM